MKRLFQLLILGTYFLVSCSSPEIASTDEGGEWNNPQTWQNRKIPNADSDVIINGKVLVKEPIECKNLKIMKEGNLEFSQAQDSLVANVSDIIVINDGKMIIRENWKVYTIDINITDSAKIQNFGVLSIGK